MNPKLVNANINVENIHFIELPHISDAADIPQGWFLKAFLHLLKPDAHGVWPSDATRRSPRSASQQCILDL